MENFDGENIDKLLEIRPCQNFAPYSILKIIPTKSSPFNKIHANILIKHKKLYLATISTLNKHEKLSTARDSFNCSHRYTKYLIVGLRLYKSNCVMAWEIKQQS